MTLLLGLVVSAFGGLMMWGGLSGTMANIIGAAIDPSQMVSQGSESPATPLNPVKAAADVVTGNAKPLEQKASTIYPSAIANPSNAVTSEITKALKAIGL